MNIFKMDFKRNFRPLMIWSGATAVITALFLALYPSMMNSDFMELMNAKMDAMPAELVNMFHMYGEDFTNLPEFFGMMLQFMMIAACIYGAMLGINSLSREEGEGTISFLYSKPVTRLRIVSSKLASASASYLIYYLIFTAAGIITSMCVKPDDLSFFDMAAAEKSIMLGGMLAGYVYLFLGFAISAAMHGTRHASSLAMGLFFGTYILGSIPSMMGILDFLKWISPMNYFVPSDIVVGGIDFGNVALSLIIMGACAAVAYPVYRKKDFLV